MTIDAREVEAYFPLSEILIWQEEFPEATDIVFSEKGHEWFYELLQQQPQYPSDFNAMASGGAKWRWRALGVHRA